MSLRLHPVSHSKSQSPATTKESGDGRNVSAGAIEYTVEDHVPQDRGDLEALFYPPPKVQVSSSSGANGFLELLPSSAVSSTFPSRSLP